MGGWAILAVSTHVLRRWLAEDRYDGPGVIAQWSARGWLQMPPGAKGQDRTVRVDGQTMRCICILRSIVEQAMSDGEGTP